MTTELGANSASASDPPPDYMQGRLRVCLVSAYSDRATGGLASYVRCLSERLGWDHKVCIVARFDSPGRGTSDYAAWEPPAVRNGGIPTHIIAPRSLFVPALRRIPGLISRRPTQPLAVSLFRHAYQQRLAEAIPAAVDVVHYVGTGWELLGFAALAEARKRGAGFTVLPAVHPDTWGDSPLDVRLYNQADAVLTLSDHERQHLIRLGTNAALLRTIGLAPASEVTGNEGRFRRTHRLGSRPLVLFVGRKNRGKGYHALRRAMASVMAAVPSTCLITVGPDAEPPYPQLPEGALLDLGQAEETDKADALAACNVFCMPSAHESFGIAYVEAWSYGKPVVAGPAPAVRELVTDGVNGFCVSQDPTEIAAALVRLLRDPALCQHMGAAGQALQQERYTWDAVTEVHETVFRRVLQITEQ